MKRYTVHTLLLVILSLSGSHVTTMAAEDMPELEIDRPVWHADSNNGLYRVTIGPSASALSIGQFQQWVVEIQDSDRSPVYPAQILIGGGMLGHRHGLPTQPQITAYLGAGRYVMDGVKLNMEGEWTFVFDIQSDLGSDTASVVVLAEY